MLVVVMGTSYSLSFSLTGQPVCVNTFCSCFNCLVVFVISVVEQWRRAVEKWKTTSSVSWLVEGLLDI